MVVLNFFIYKFCQGVTPTTVSTHLVSLSGRDITKSFLRKNRFSQGLMLTRTDIFDILAYYDLICLFVFTLIQLTSSIRLNTESKYFIYKKITLTPF